MMTCDDDMQWSDQILDMEPRSEEALESMLELHPNGWFTLEWEQITLPSLLAPGEIECLSLNSISMMEGELCKAQVTDALEGLCLALGKKFLCFHTEVCNADSQRTTHQAWDNIHKLDAEAQWCRSTYWHTCSALQYLSIDSEYLATLHNITNNDLKVAGDLTDTWIFGQQSDTLPWFWKIGKAMNDPSGPRMQECMYSSFPWYYLTHLL